jgi:hypothetical protein
MDTKESMLKKFHTSAWTQNIGMLTKIVHTLAWTQNKACLRNSKRQHGKQILRCISYNKTYIHQHG